MFTGPWKSVLGHLRNRAIHFAIGTRMKAAILELFKKLEPLAGVESATC